MFPLVDPLPSTDSAAAFRPGVVRPLLRYYGIVRLPAGVHVGRAAYGLPRPFLATIVRGNLLALPVPVRRVSTHARGLGLRGVKDRLAMIVGPHVAFPLSEWGRHAEAFVSELNTRPACAPVNASPAVLPPPAHDSGLVWIARPLPYGSFIRYSPPVFTGAFFDPEAPPRNLVGVGLQGGR